MENKAPGSLRDGKQLAWRAPIPSRPGAIGALIDELQRALAELESLLLPLDAAALDRPRADQRARSVALELCPLSNLRTGVVASLAAHPALDWLRRGLKVSLNTDAPALFHTSLAGEFEAQLGLGATRAEVLEFLWRALESCWLPADERRRLAVRCAARLAELEVPASTTPAGPKAPAGSDLASA